MLGITAAWLAMQPSTHVEASPSATLSGNSDGSDFSDNSDNSDRSDRSELSEKSALSEKPAPSEASAPIPPMAPGEAIPVEVAPSAPPAQGRPMTRLTEADLRAMTASHPFAREAAAVLRGGLSATDSASRRIILNYCEHLRTAYTTKDIDFLRQVFSDDALIIVGTVVSNRKAPGSITAGGSENVRYSLRTKSAYIARLSDIFAANRRIDMRFSDFRIMRHPSLEGIYGVTLRQRYASDGYSDDGWLFLLWDFRDPSMPQIHVRTWQPSSTVTSDDDLIDLSDFNLD